MHKKELHRGKGTCGNSYIHFTLEGSDSFGSIQTLFSTDQIPKHHICASRSFCGRRAEGPSNRPLPQGFQPPLPTTRKTKDP
ncbi:hypothetical protein PSTT_13336 [Puccinia striiformis]|uniref:Uncharacterized protein n=1 Tax=Puccinia striiformis TaxID=27350 RepID=A0A2S4USD5_9BASI|nr:hypothetical protein PSTT_13336 [Puccinia striiformis]